MARHVIRLQVLKIASGDVYKDFVRIPEQHRGGVGEGRICTLRVGDKSIRRAIRGHMKDQEDNIRMDDYTRHRLNVASGRRYSFSIKQCGWVGQFLWAWNASDPASRIAARLGILGAVLGVVGLILGIMAIH